MKYLVKNYRYNYSKYQLKLSKIISQHLANKNSLNIS